MLGVYQEQIAGAAPVFPVSMEDRITASLLPPTPDAATTVALPGLFGAQTAPVATR